MIVSERKWILNIFQHIKAAYLISFFVSLYEQKNNFYLIINFRKDYSQSPARKNQTYPRKRRNHVKNVLIRIVSHKGNKSNKKYYFLWV